MVSPFARDLRALLALWPALWLLGIEQFAVPLFAGVQLLLTLYRRRGRLTINLPSLLAILLAAWWLVAIRWVEQADYDLFLKQFSTAGSLAILLLLFDNEIRTDRDQRCVVRGLYLLGMGLAGGLLLGLIPAFRRPFPSLLGLVLPDHLASSSAFFESIVTRHLVSLPPGEPWRLSSLALRSSSLSLTLLLLVPLTVWVAQRSRGTARITAGLLLIANLVALHLAASRVAIAALAVGAAVYLALASRRLRWLAAVVPLAAITVCAFEFVSIQAAISWNLPAQLEDLLILKRSSSWDVRSRVYTETLALLPEHWVTGWGLPVEIPGMLTVYSAGTHASHLGLAFQHGVVGLGLYLALWTTLLARLARALVYGDRHGLDRLFWVAMAAGLCAFLARSIADTWWWDQLTVLTVACCWGLVSLLPSRATSTGA